MAKDKKFTILQENIISLWLQDMPNSEIAEKLECSLEYVRKVKQDKDCKQLFFEAQAGQIIELLPLAVKRLRNMLYDDSVQASVQIAAIKEVFDRAHLSELTETNKEIKITVSYE